MRVLGLAALAVAVMSTRVEAQCINVVSRCFCPEQPGRVGIVVTESIDGGTATVRVESSQRGLVVDGGLSFAVFGAETPGSRWLLNEERRPVNGAGQVTCADFPATPIAVETAANAAVSASCAEDLAAAGLKQPPCNDTRGCSTAPLALLPLLSVGWLLRRQS